MGWLVFREPFSSWSHVVWFLLSLPATVLLWRLSRGDRLKQFGFLVFGLSLTCCFGSSVLYHCVRLPPTQLGWFETLDFIGVYLLIAGTVTPVALVVLQGRWRWGILGAVWLIGSSGIGLRLAGVPLSRFFSTGIYLGMGWAVVLAYFELAERLGHRAMWPSVLGGVLYTVGAVLNHLNWPALWPGAFSAHELWHLFVMAGSLSHFCLMLWVVVPFQRVPGIPAAVPIGAVI